VFINIGKCCSPLSLFSANINSSMMLCFDQFNITLVLGQEEVATTKSYGSLLLLFLSLFINLLQLLSL